MLSELVSLVGWVSVSVVGSSFESLLVGWVSFSVVGSSLVAVGWTSFVGRGPGGGEVFVGVQVFDGARGRRLLAGPDVHAVVQGERSFPAHGDVFDVAQQFFGGGQAVVAA